MKLVERYMKPSKSSHSLLALVFAMSCLDFSSCNGGGDIASELITYPPRVLRTAWEECPPDNQRQIIRAEVEQDLCNILWRYFGRTCIVHMVLVGGKIVPCNVNK